MLIPASSGTPGPGEITRWFEGLEVLVHREDDRRIGVKSTALLFGDAVLVSGSLVDYPDNRDRPDLPDTSRLSPHLHFGEISPHRVWRHLQAPSSNCFASPLCPRSLPPGMRLPCHVPPMFMRRSFYAHASNRFCFYKHWIVNVRGLGKSFSQGIVFG